MFSSILQQWKLKRKLSAYVATLSPEKQKQANEFRKKLDSASTTEQSLIILHNEIANISAKQMKVIQRLSHLR